MRSRIVLILGAIILAASAATIGWGASRALAGERPPECVHARMSINGGSAPYAYVAYCGMGSGGESPLRGKARNLIMDGTHSISPKECPKANPCTIFWPASPQS